MRCRCCFGLLGKGTMVSILPWCPSPCQLPPSGTTCNVTINQSYQPFGGRLRGRFWDPRIVFLGYKHTSNLKIFSTALGSATAAVEAVLRTARHACRQGASPGGAADHFDSYLTIAYLCLLRRLFTAVSPKIAKISRLRRIAQGLSYRQHRCFSYRRNTTPQAAQNPYLGRSHYGIERFNWRPVL